MNWELSDAQTGFSKGKGIRDQIANIHWIVEKAREFQKNIYFCFIDYTKAFNCVDHSKLRNILEERGMPDHLTRNLYADEEATVRTRHGTTDWFKLGKGVHQGYIFSPCLFNFYAEYILWNTGLDEMQAGIKIAWRNSNSSDMQMSHHLPITGWGTNGKSDRLFSWAPKSLQPVRAAMKLKDACSLEEKQWQT